MMPGPWSRRRLDGLEEEIREHIARETEENIERGMPPDEARYAALRKFGNVARVQEDTRAVWSVVWLEQLFQDVRYGARMLRGNPGFTAVAIATLALGIGMNTAVFSVVNAVLFHPLPYPNADRLVWLANYSQWARRDTFTGRTEYRTWKNQARSFESMAAYGNDDLALVSGGEASEERIASVTDDFWTMTAAQPAIGRIFRVEEPNMMVLSWPLFQRRFHGDPNIIGKTVTLNGYPHTITGVLSSKFQFAVPQQYYKGDETRDIDAYISIPEPLMALSDTTKAVLWYAAEERFGPCPWALHVVARLRPGASLEQARAEMQTLYGRTEQQKIAVQRDDSSLHFCTLQEKVAGDARRDGNDVRGDERVVGGFVRHERDQIIQPEK